MSTDADADAKRRRELRRELRRQGLCISCGTAEATLNKDGNQGLRCDPCGAVYSGQKGHVKNRKRREARPVIKHDADGDTLTYLDSVGFALYCKAVLGTISRTTVTDMAAIKTRMGEAYDQKRHQDALDALRALGEIEQVWGYRPRYLRKTPRQVETSFNRDQSTTPKPAPHQPHIASVYGNKYATVY